MKLNVELKNCYGIGELKYDFDFSNSNICLIYAQNGVFKTSFARTIQDIIDNKETKDMIYQERQTKRKVERGDVKISKENTLVIESFNKDFNSQDSVNKIVASKELKQKYDNIFKSLDKQKKELIKQIKQDSGSSDCEKEILKIYNQNTFYQVLDENLDEILTQDTTYNFKYHDIFDDKGAVKEFLNKNSNLLEEYFNKYNELLSHSSIFKQTESGSFGTNQFNIILKALEDDRFFKAQHELVVANQTIKNYESLKSLVNDEINKIINNKDLKNKFEIIENQIKNKALNNFKEAIQANNVLLVELKDYENFRKKVIFSFLNKHKDSVQALVESYRCEKENIHCIIKESLKEQEKWKEIIEIFNDRFFVPFSVEIKNQQEVILKQEIAEFKFNFNDSKSEGNQKVEIDKDTLIEVLSMGEKRALYILQVLFEIESRKVQNVETLLIFDDISDSFDYKNKYAIIEYLYDLKNNANFKMIVMTHNFDFYRNLKSRLNIKRSNIFMANKIGRKITFDTGQYGENIINTLKSGAIKDNAKFITLIPFARNLIEYTQDTHDKSYETLTKCLHIKSDTNKILVKDVEGILNQTLNIKRESGDETCIKDFIYQEADKIIKDNNTNPIFLENKIVLSIAIRLKAEEFMINKLKQQGNYNEPTSKQTRKLFDSIKDLVDDATKRKIDRVLMTTSENIHINSFMFEPILDMSIEHLKELYKGILSLN